MIFSERVRKMVEEGSAYPLATESEEEEEGAIKMCSNENPLGPSPKAVEAIELELDRVGRYPESLPIELKRAIGDYLGVDPLQVCVGNGSDEIMDLVCKATMDPGDRGLVPMPSFSWYELVYRVNAMRPKFIELEDFQWDSELLVEGMEDVEAAFIGRPNNPTGNSIREEGLRDLLETGKVVIVDEAYGEFAGYSVVDWVEEYENLLVLRTFSKLFGLAGIRVGYGIANEDLIEGLERVRPPFSVNRLAQKAAVAALKDREFMKKSKEMVLEGRDYLHEELVNLDFEVLPSDANFIMASPRPLGLNAQDICDYLSENGIIIRDLSGFRGAGPDWVRITVGTTEQNKRLIKTLKEYIEKG